MQPSESSARAGLLRGLAFAVPLALLLWAALGVVVVGLWW